jgi:hypothetical protein
MATPAARQPGPQGGALAQPDDGEHRLDGVGGAQVAPVLGGEVVERQQLVELVGDLGGRLGMGGEVGGEAVGGLEGLAAGVGGVDVG